MNIAVLTASGWSADRDDTNRVLTEDGSMSFFAGRAFRFFIELDIPAGGKLWVKITMTNNFVLRDQRVSIQSGAIRWTANAAMASTPGPWTARTVRRMNQMTEQQTPLFVSGATIESSTDPVAATGGVVVDVFRVAAGQGAGSSSAEQTARLRGLPPGVFHVLLENTDAQPAVGVYDFWWEERP